MAQYEVVIGLETHVQMNTKTKLFCNCDNNSFGKQANTNVCELCMGFPGTLPMPNEAAIKKGIAAGLALNCTIPQFCKFDRKHYFYPDLPKGYQITQYDEPIAVEGYIEVEVSGVKKKIGIERMHLEEDAGKLVHTGMGTMVDYNRAGTPLMEIVSRPDIRSKEEASCYAKTIQQIMRFIGVSDADMEKGMMRFDLNISLRPMGSEVFGKKVEVKNLNSFKGLEKAIVFEIDRQSKLLDQNQPVAQETRGWDADKEITESQRSKEVAADYRYFPEPDIPPFHITAEEIEAQRSLLPELPQAKLERYHNVFGLDRDQARIISENFDYSRFFEQMLSFTNAHATASNFFTTDVLGYLNQSNSLFADLKVKPQQLAHLATLVNQNVISSKMAKEVLKLMLESGKDPDQIIEEQGFKQVSDQGTLEAVCKAAIVALPNAVTDIKNGNSKAIGALVGYVMKETKGQANPGKVNQILLQLINH